MAQVTTHRPRLIRSAAIVEAGRPKAGDAQFPRARLEDVHKAVVQEQGKSDDELVNGASARERMGARMGDTYTNPEELARKERGGIHRVQVPSRDRFALVARMAADRSRDVGLPMR